MMKEKYQKIIKKYRDKFFCLEDRPPLKAKVVYLPTYDAMIYALYDDAYDYFKCSPGDTLIIKKILRQDQICLIYFQENKFCTTPAELVLSKYVEKTDIDFIKKIYLKLREQKLKQEK